MKNIRQRSTNSFQVRFPDITRSFSTLRAAIKFRDDYIKEIQASKISRMYIQIKEMKRGKYKTILHFTESVGVKPIVRVLSHHFSIEESVLMKEFITNKLKECKTLFEIEYQLRVAEGIEKYPNVFINGSDQYYYVFWYKGKFYCEHGFTSTKDTVQAMSNRKLSMILGGK